MFGCVVLNCVSLRLVGSARNLLYFSLLCCVVLCCAVS